MPILVSARAFPMMRTMAAIGLLMGKDVLDLGVHHGFEGIGLPLGFLRWTFETKPFSAMNASFFSER